MFKNILALDFDGTLSTFESGYTAADVTPDPPVDGAVAAAAEYNQFFSLHVYSARAGEPGGEDAIRHWLRKWKFPEGMKVSAKKPHAKVYIDDRAIQFNGKFPTVAAIETFLPWYQRGVPQEDASAAALGEIRKLLDENTDRLAEMSGDKEKPVTDRIRALIARITPKK